MEIETFNPFSLAGQPGQFVARLIMVGSQDKARQNETTTTTRGGEKIISEKCSRILSDGNGKCGTFSHLSMAILLEAGQQHLHAKLI